MSVLFFNLDSDSSLKRPLIIHRALLGSIERFLAILLEHYNGKLPFWINPRQAMIISTTPNAFEYAQEIQKDLSSQKQRNGLFYYCNVDNSDRTLSKKVREAVVDGYSYVIVVGEREMSNKTVFLKKREDIKAAGAEMTLDQVRELFQDLDQNYL